MVLQLLWWFPWHLRVIKNGLDNSFRYAQNELFVRGADFANGVLVQYGPYGFLKNDLYHPDTVHLLIGVRVLFFVVFAALLARASTRLEFGFARAAIWIALLVLVARFGEPFFLSLGVLAFLVFWMAGSTEERIMWSPAALVLALASLMQFTYAIFSVGLILVMVLTVVCQWALASSFARSRRRWEPVVEATVWPALFGFGSIFLWVAAGQNAGTLLDFVTTRLQLTSGYSISHGLAGPLWQVVVFVVAAALFWGVFVAREVRRSGLLVAPPALALGMLLVLAFKHSFVRHDAGHAAYGAFEGFCLVLIFGPWMARPVAGVLDQPRRTMAVLASLLLVLASAALITYDREHWWGARFFRHLDPVTTAASARRAVTRPDLVEFRHRREKARIRTQEPLPQLVGSVDVYPWEMSLAYAHDLELDSRPTLQSYQSSDPELAELNARHVAKPDGPDHLLFRVATIDHRYPSMDDGLSWPHILAGFKLRSARGSHLVLRRSDRPRQFAFNGERSHSVRFGELLPVEDGQRRLHWMRVHTERTARGRLAAAAFRGPVLLMRIELANGTERWYRILPGMARAGFLLSPVVTDTRDFAYLMNGSWPTLLAGKQVTALEFATEFGAGWYWRQPLRVEIGELTFDE